MTALAQRVGHEGRPHLLTVIGQAGVGKSRLLRELSAQAADLDPAPKLRTGECPPYGSGIAFWAMAEVIRAEFGISAGEAAESRLDQAARRNPGAARRLGRGRVRRAHRRGDRRHARHRGRRGGHRRRRRRPAADAGDPVLGGSIPGRGDDGRAPPGAGLRGHPLGRRGHARPDRAPGPLGQGTAADRLPRPRRAARAPLRLGRRAAQLDHRRPRPPLARRDPEAGRGPLQRRHQRRLGAGLARRPAGGGNPLFAEEIVNRLRRRARTRTPSRKRFTRCSPPASTRWRRSSGACSSTRRWSGRTSGRAC